MKLRARYRKLKPKTKRRIRNIGTGVAIGGALYLARRPIAHAYQALTHMQATTKLANHIRNMSPREKLRHLPLIRGIL